VTKPLHDFLPYAFGPDALGVEERTLPPTSKKLFNENDASVTKAVEGNALLGQALTAAKMSYAPYSQTAGGVALRMADGSVHCGYGSPRTSSLMGTTRTCSVLTRVHAAGVGEGGCGSTRKAFNHHNCWFTLPTHLPPPCTRSYIENAAFNPSMLPLQCALIAMLSEAGEPGGIEEAALVHGHLYSRYRAHTHTHTHVQAR